MSKHVTISPSSRRPSRDPRTRRGLCLSRCKRSKWPLYAGLPLRRVHEREASSLHKELHSREALAPVFADLNQYAATMHFLGDDTSR